MSQTRYDTVSKETVCPACGGNAEIVESYDEVYAVCDNMRMCGVGDVEHDASTEAGPCSNCGSMEPVEVKCGERIQIAVRDE